MAEGEEEEEWRSRGASRRNSTLPQHDASSARPSVRPTDSLDTMLEVAPGNANERRGSSFAVERRGSSFARRSSDISRRESILERRDSSFGIGRPRSSTLGATDDDVTAIRLAESRAEAAPDEAFASSLAESTAALEELITSASKRVHEVQEGAAEQLTPDARAEFEKAMADVFDGMMRNAKQIAKEMSDSDAKANRAQAKTAARLFQIKLEHARTAANVSLKNKSIEMSATFHKKLLDKVQELNEGGSSLLSEAQERHDDLIKQLEGEKLRHESAKETLKVSQRLLHTARRW